MLETVRPEALLPDRALCLPIFSHFLIVNTTSLSIKLLYLSFSLSHQNPPRMFSTAITCLYRSYNVGLKTAPKSIAQSWMDEASTGLWMDEGQRHEVKLVLDA
jgi:hypothetical protein